jgi:hypothetical protein
VRHRSLRRAARGVQRAEPGEGVGAECGAQQETAGQRGGVHGNSKDSGHGVRRNGRMGRCAEVDLCGGVNASGRRR